METLIVKYLPRGERSHTGKLLDAFVNAAGIYDAVCLDLCEDVPENFVKNNLLAYVERNYLGQDITASQEFMLRQSDMFCSQLLEAKKIVMAFPMHNFSLPAIIKSWFDSVMQKNRTFSVDKDGYHGLLPASKAVIFMASGGIYEGDTAGYDFALPLARHELSFMGVDEVLSAVAPGMNLPDGRADERLEAGICRAREIGFDW